VKESKQHSFIPIVIFSHFSNSFGLLAGLKAVGFVYNRKSPHQYTTLYHSRSSIWVWIVSEGAGAQTWGALGVNQSRLFRKQP